jgi:uncharacterized protein YbbK (DUF523 family)
MEKLRLGISSCLLGEEVRYDGGHRHAPYITDTLGQYVEWVPVCPEVECGMPVPREPMRLEGDPHDPRLVVINTGEDKTQHLREWAAGKAAELEKEELDGFIFKSGSPSCGMERVKVFDEEGVCREKGLGLFAAAMMELLPRLPVTDEKQMSAPVNREKFVKTFFGMKKP